MIYTIGHSNHPRDRFLGLLKAAEITAVGDVRSSPRSRFPHFNGPALRTTLEAHGITYAQRGQELGGRTASRTHTYEEIARTAEFAFGIKWVLWMARNFRLALLCSEAEPMECHRCLLIGRHLHDQGEPVAHILKDGSVEPHAAFQDRLIAKARFPDTMTEPDRLSEAYRKQARRLGVGA